MPNLKVLFSPTLDDSRRRQWHPTPVLLPGKSHGQRSLVGGSPWGLEESDTTERLHFHFSLPCIGEGNGNPLQGSCLENPRDRGAWWAAVYGVAQSLTRLKRLSSCTAWYVGFQFPDQGSNPGPLHRKHAVLTIVSPGKLQGGILSKPKEQFVHHFGVGAAQKEHLLKNSCFTAVTLLAQGHWPYSAACVALEDVRAQQVGWWWDEDEGTFPKVEWKHPPRAVGTCVQRTGLLCH